VRECYCRGQNNLLRGFVAIQPAPLKYPKSGLLRIKDWRAQTGRLFRRSPHFHPYACDCSAEYCDPVWSQSAQAKRLNVPYHEASRTITGCIRCTQVRLLPALAIGNYVSRKLQQFEIQHQHLRKTFSTRDRP
jgi:hypothetical protein